MDYEDFITDQGEYEDEDDYLYEPDAMDIAKENKTAIVPQLNNKHNGKKED